MSTRPDAQGWQRLDPRMLLIHPLTALIRFLPALLALFVARSGMSAEDRWEWIALPILVLWGVLRWTTTRYRITGEQLELRTGVLARSTRTARLDRIRAVDLTSEIHHRMLGLSRVQISTGSAAKDRIELDSLGHDAAQSLRHTLLARVAAGPVDLPAPQGDPLAEADAPAEPLTPAASPVRVLTAFRPSWVAYAPFTATGLGAAAAIFGTATQVLQRRLFSDEALGRGTDVVRSVGLWVWVMVALVVVAGLAVGAYVLSFSGFRLARSADGLHVRRGLLTRRETSIDAARLRGVALGLPLGLRLAGGGRLRAVSTGLSSEQGGGSDWLVPPAPVATARAVGVEVSGDGEAVLGRLVAHGPVAARRRLVRAVAAGAVLAGAVVVAAHLLWEVNGWVLGLAAMLLISNVGLGVDRLRGLGHAVTDRHLVTQSGSLLRERVALQHAGVIGWTVRQSWWQRRQGLATLTATTAAGAQHYDVIDVPVVTAWQVVATVSPDLAPPG